MASLSSELEDNDDIFDDGNIGLGSDGLTHSDPWCAAIAPLGTPEARHGEFCDLCYQREAERGARGAQ